MHKKRNRLRGRERERGGGERERGGGEKWMHVKRTQRIALLDYSLFELIYENRE